MKKPDRAANPIFITNSGNNRFEHGTSFITYIHQISHATCLHQSSATAKHGPRYRSTSHPHTDVQQVHAAKYKGVIQVQQGTDK